MKTRQQNCVAFVGLILWAGFCSAASITSSCTAGPTFNTSWIQGCYLAGDLTTNTTTITIITPSTALADQTFRYTGGEIEPSSLSLSKGGYTASTYASDNSTSSLLECILSSDFPDSITTASCRYRHLPLVFQTAPHTGSDLYALQLTALPEIHIIYNNDLQAAMTVTYSCSMKFFIPGQPVIDRTWASATYDLTDTSGVYDLVIPLSYSGLFTEPEVHCFLTTELFSIIHIPEPATLLLLGLGGFLLRRNKYE
jgi:hypothetical protein